MALTQTLSGQTVKIMGKVIDMYDNSPLPGASILVKGTMYGTASDINGNFSLNFPLTASKLIISFIGFKTLEFDLEGCNYFEIMMAPDHRKFKRISSSVQKSTRSFESQTIATEAEIAKDQSQKAEQSSQQTQQTPSGGIKVRPRDPEPQIPPLLSISNIAFNDNNSNNRIDANEKCSISFTISNSGKGAARNLTMNIQNNSAVKGLDYSNSKTIGSLEPSTSQTITIPISGSMNLTSGMANFNVSFEEQLGFPPDPFELKIETKEFVSPNLQVVDHSFLTDNGVIRLGFPIQLKVLIQNIGQGTAEDVKVNFQYPSQNVFPNGPNEFAVGTLPAGATKELVFEFIANKLYTDQTIPVTARISEKFGKFATNKQVFASIDSKTSGTSITIASNAPDSKVDIQVASLTAEVDKNIPLNPNKYPDRLALIIGNEDYSSRQKGLSSESNVAFAVNDANIFKEYCMKTLGVEEKNVFVLTNATAGEMNQKIELVTQILSRLQNKGELIFFYAGHGFPDEVTREPYLIPVDVSATSLQSAIKLNDVYHKFSQTGAKRITVFLDACFTGGGRESGLLAARIIKVQPRENTISGNMVVFAATSEDQSALPYIDKQHGMFTYYLLKKIQETKGDITYGDLDNYIVKNVSLESLRVNGKAQDPKTNVSLNAKNEWEKWKLK